MMLVFSLISLAIAMVSACLSINSQEEVFKAAMAFAALVASLLTLFLAPWILKLLIVLAPLMLEKLNSGSIGHWNN